MWDAGLETWDLGPAEQPRYGMRDMGPETRVPCLKSRISYLGCSEGLWSPKSQVPHPANPGCSEGLRSPKSQVPHLTSRLFRGPLESQVSSPASHISGVPKV